MLTAQKKKVSCAFGTTSGLSRVYEALHRPQGQQAFQKADPGGSALIPNENTGMS